MYINFWQIGKAADTIKKTITCKQRQGTEKSNSTKLWLVHNKNNRLSMMTGDWYGSPTAAGAVIDHLWVKTIACLWGRGLKTVQQLVLWLVVARKTIACLKTGDWQQSNSNVLWLVEVSERVRDKKIQSPVKKTGDRCPTAASSCDCWYYLGTCSRLLLVGWSLPPPDSHATPHNLI